MGVASCSAKLLVVIFSLTLLLIGVGVTAVGITSLNVFGPTFLSGAIPHWLPKVLTSVGILMGLLGLTGIIGTTCCSDKIKCALGIISLFTLIFIALFGAITFGTFAYSDMANTAFESGFSDAAGEVIQWFYRALRDAFASAYVQCDPTSYFTTQVKTACSTAAILPGNVLNVSACSSADYGAVSSGGYYGMYCRSGPGLSPFSVDKMLQFPPTGPSGIAPIDMATLLKMSSFSYFLNAACTPNRTRYWDMMVELVAMGTPINLPGTVQATARNSTFGKCYMNSWWAQDGVSSLSPEVQQAISDPLAIPGKISQQPGGGALSIAQATFFDGLQASRTADLGNPLLSAKLSFCFCADEGSKSPLFEFLTGTVLKDVRWIALGLTALYIVTFIAEMYLCCCKKKSKKEQMQQLNEPIDHSRLELAEKNKRSNPAVDDVRARHAARQAGHSNAGLINS
jgi:hypothetical protein